MKYNDFRELITAVLLQYTGKKDLALAIDKK
jgi:hypothetical protein